MFEKNSHILQEAIQKLPQHEPPAMVWLAIDAELEAIEKENNLQNALNDLPVYSPSNSIWDGIEKELESDRKKAGRVVWFKRISAAAAAIALLVAGNIILKPNTALETITFSYTQEVVKEELIVKDWDDDNDAFQMVMAFCETENIVCKLPEFQMLKSELEELNSAREELKTALDHYGTDPELVAQLTRIEHDRSDILKKMIARI